MTRAVYVAAGEAGSNKGTVALGLVELLSRQVGTVGVFRPVVRAGREDSLINAIRSRFQLGLPYAAYAGVTYDEVHADAERAAGEIVARYRALAGRCDAVVVVGTDYTDVGAPTEFGYNARLAADLGTPVINVVSGRGRTGERIAAAVELSSRELAQHHAHELAVVISRAAAGPLTITHPTPVFVLPETSSLRAPTVADLLDACDGRFFLGERDGLGREASALMVGAMSLPNILDRYTEGTAVIIPSDRAAALLPGLIAAHTSPGFPALSAVVVTGGTDLPAPVDRLLRSMAIPLPVIATDHDTFDTATRLSAVEGRFTPEAGGKIDTALRLFAEHVDGRLLLERLAITKTDVVTPLMFEYELLDRARARRRHIVLPEGEEPRILRAADVLLRRGVAELTLLGDEERIRVRAAQLGLDLDEARVLSPFDAELRERFAREYAAVRAHRGMTVELARDTVTDVSYFGTLMVHTGMADGMVSGAAHTTAHTIRPAFEILRLGLVSSVFFMCLADRVLVYGDCAVNPVPTAEQRRCSASIPGSPCCRTRRAPPAPAPTSTRSAPPPSWCANAAPTSRWKGRSSTTPRSTPAWHGPRCPTARSPDTPPSSSCPTSTPATTCTRPSSAVPAPSRWGRCSKGWASRSTTCRAAPPSPTSSPPSPSRPRRWGSGLTVPRRALDGHPPAPAQERPVDGSRARVWRAISHSSSVGMTRTGTSAPGGDTARSPADSAWLDAGSTAMPSRPSPARQAARVAASFSPTPPVNTIASTRPSSAWYAPTYLRIRRV
jgi:phosphate acetyltransferase